MTDRPANLHIRVIDWGKQHGDVGGEPAMLRHPSTESDSRRCYLIPDRPADSSRTLATGATSKRIEHHVVTTEELAAVLADLLRAPAADVITMTLYGSNGDRDLQYVLPRHHVPLFKSSSTATTERRAKPGECPTPDQQLEHLGHRACPNRRRSRVLTRRAPAAADLHATPLSRSRLRRRCPPLPHPRPPGLLQSAVPLPAGKPVSPLRCDRQLQDPCQTLRGKQS